MDSSEFIFLFFNDNVQDCAHISEYSDKFLNLFFGQSDLLLVLSFSIKFDHFDIFLLHSQQDFKLFRLLHWLLISFVGSLTCLQEPLLYLIYLFSPFVYSFPDDLYLILFFRNTFIDKVESILVVFSCIM